MEGMRESSVYDSLRRCTRSMGSPCRRRVAVSRCLLWSGLARITPIPDFCSPCTNNHNCEHDCSHLMIVPIYAVEGTVWPSVLYNPDGIVLPDVQQITLTKILNTYSNRYLCVGLWGPVGSRGARTMVSW